MSHTPTFSITIEDGTLNDVIFYTVGLLCQEILDNPDDSGMSRHDRYKGSTIFLYSLMSEIKSQWYTLPVVGEIQFNDRLTEWLVWHGSGVYSTESDFKLLESLHKRRLPEIHY